MRRPERRAAPRRSVAGHRDDRDARLRHALPRPRRSQESPQEPASLWSSTPPTAWARSAAAADRRLRGRPRSSASARPRSSWPARAAWSPPTTRSSRETLRLGRDYGNPGDYDCRFVGLNARMSELHAAVALHSLSLARRARGRGATSSWRRSGPAVAGVRGLRARRSTPGTSRRTRTSRWCSTPRPSGSTCPRWRSPWRPRASTPGSYYYPSIHRQTAYAHLPWRDLPVTEKVSPRVLSLPLWSHMDDTCMSLMADAINRIGSSAHALLPVLEGRGAE